MGMANSHRVEDDAEDRGMGDEADGDIGQLLQYLIRSGQVHIIASDPDESSEEDFNIVTPPRTVPNPNTEVLDKSSFKVLTRVSSGLTFKTGQKRPSSMLNLVSARERGLPGSGCFTNGDRCRLINNFLPNKRFIAANYRSKLFCGSYSKDGSMFLTASQDRKLRVFDSRTERLSLKRVISGRNVGWSILDTAFSPDGQHVAYSSWSECIQLCSLHEDTEQQDSLLIAPPEGSRFCIFSLVFSSDNNEILCGSNDRCIYIYDRGCDRQNLRIPSHEDDVNTVAFADDTSQIVYSGGDDGIVKVWDRRTLSEAAPVPVGMLAGHMDGITHVEPRGDGRHLLSNSKDQSIKLWDVRKFSSEEAVAQGKKAVDEQSWDYRWQGIPKVLKDPRKRITGDTSLMTYCGHSVLQTLCRCHFSPTAITGQRYIYTGCAAGRVVIYDALTGRIVKELSGQKGCVRDVAWHPYRPEILSTSWDGTICQWTYSEDLNEDPLKGVQLRSTGVRRSQRIKDQLKRRLEALNTPSDDM